MTDRSCRHEGASAGKVCPRCGVRVRQADVETIAVAGVSASRATDAAPEGSSYGAETVGDARPSEAETIDDSQAPPETQANPLLPVTGAFEKTVQEPPPSTPQVVDQLGVTVPEPPPSTALSPPSAEDRTVTEAGPSASTDATITEEATASARASARASTGAAPSSLSMSRIEDGADAAGRTFDRGKYEIVKEIARGGMGVVYKARQRDLNRVVALKVMLSGAHASETEKQRFIREAEASARLKHPHIVPVYDIGEESGNLFFTMDFVEGAPLSAKKKEMDRAKLLDVMVKTCDGVAYAHLRGIIHRDLKPANVMINKEGEPQIMDFGLAKQVAETDEGGKLSQQTREGAVMGTPHYMPPEQALGLISEIDLRADVYALGVMLYELWTGRLPFNAPSFATLIHMIVEQEPVAPRQVDPTIPWEIEAIALKAMEKQKTKRYDSALELKRDLERFRDGVPILARKATLVYRARRWAWRNRISIGIGAGVLSVIVGATVVTLRQASAAQRANEERQARAVATVREGLGPAEKMLEAARASVRAFRDDPVRPGAEEEAGNRLGAAREAATGLASQAVAASAFVPSNESARALVVEVRDRLEKPLADLASERETGRRIKEQLAVARAKLDQATKRFGDGKAIDAAADFAAEARAIDSVIEEGMKAALAATGLGGTKAAEPVIDALQDLSKRVNTAREKRADRVRAEASLVLGEKELDEAKKRRENGDFAAAADHASKSVEALLAAKSVAGAAFEPKLLEARAVLGSALVHTGEYGAARRLIEALDKAGAAGKVGREIQDEYNQARADADRTQRELKALRDRVQAANDPARPVKEARSAAAEAVRAAQELLASGRGMSEQDRSDAEDVKKRARLAELVLEARVAREDAAAVDLKADPLKVEVVTKDMDDALAAYAKAEPLSPEPRAIQEEALVCRREKADAELRAAEELKRRNDPRSIDRARRARDLFAELGEREKVRFDAADELWREAQRLTQKPEGMLLWKGAANVELGGGAQDRNPVRIVARIAPFYIAAKETTNAEFLRFVREGGYAKKEYWKDLPPGLDPTRAFVDRTGNPGPAGWSAQQFAANEDALPVTGISWWEAAAFAEWKGYRLPTDAEWEAAARIHPDEPKVKRAFPCGDDESVALKILKARGPRAITADGADQDDRSPIGCLDMTGNVSEWVVLDRDGLSKQDLENVDAHQRGSARGGSWLAPYAPLARATHRFLPPKSARGPAIGVRLAKTPPGESR